MPDQKDEYLGDGVYASFDGYQIWLAADDPGNKVIAIEPDVLTRLIDYANRVHPEKSG
jgi:GT2 family glycosyltransferase